MTINVARYRFVFLTAAGILTAVGIAAIATYGFRLGVDFTGGGLWEVAVESRPTNDALKQVVEEATKTTATVSTDAATGHYMVRVGETNAESYAAMRTLTQEKLGAFEEFSFQSIGPSVSGKLRQNALLAIVFVLVAISLYIAISFRKATNPVRPWMYGGATLVTLFHDVVIPAGMLAILGHYGRVEIDTNFVVALLVVMGFSVHDTIVVFDRIRESLLTTSDHRDFPAIVNKSVSETLARSLNTSFTLVLVLVALLVAGPQTLYYFVLTLLVGVVAGAYSSIFVASPLLMVASRLFGKRKS